MNFQVNQTNRSRAIGVGSWVGFWVDSFFLAALQPYKWLVCKTINRPFSLVIKTKVVQNVNRMSERQPDNKITIQQDNK